ncbi:hypothetical protein PtrEW13061_011031 [Pyrenophora tritici-repentis]|nr:hypothetical protein PtrEW13061_011031 [Pyrenophora tritici-repentis]
MSVVVSQTTTFVLIPQNIYPFSSCPLVPTNDPPLNSALANMTRPAPAPATTVPPRQPYTPPGRARRSTFILRAPLLIVKETLSPGDDSARDASLTSLCKTLDPNSDALRPDASVNMLCQCLIRIPKEILRNFSCDHHPSPDTIPLALCLLVRYRVALASVPSDDCDDVVEAPEREAQSSSSCVGDVPPTVFTAVSAPVPGALSDVALITMCVYVAYQYLTADHLCVDLRQWSRPLETDAAKLIIAEREFLAAIDYRLWFRQEVYLESKGRLDELWDAVFKHAARPPPPAFLIKNLGSLG